MSLTDPAKTEINKLTNWPERYRRGKIMARQKTSHKLTRSSGRNSKNGDTSAEMGF